MLLYVLDMFEIKYDVEMDLQNYDDNYINRKFPDYGRGDFDTAPNLWPNVKESISQASHDEKLGIVKKYLSDAYSDNKAMDSSINALNIYWSSIESIYLNRLYEYMDVKEKINKIEVFFTTLSICPYNSKDNNFFVSFFSCLAVQAKTIMHESMHLIFLHNYRDYLIDRSVNEQGIIEINEALTELLNLEFRDMLLLPENNYKPSAKDLQQEVIAQYNAGKTFKQILDRLIELRTI